MICGDYTTYSPRSHPLPRSFLHQRSRAWHDANSMIANLIHPHANMSQDALDDLRVVDQRHDRHLNHNRRRNHRRS